MGDEFRSNVYSKEDFISGTAPYEEVYALRGNLFMLEQAKERMAAMAKKQGVTNFKTLFNKYCDMVSISEGKVVGQSTSFDGQPLELETGEWFANDNGVSRVNRSGFEEIACLHPIIPVHRYVDIDTGIEKLVIAYRRDDEWRTVMCERGQLASANKIVELANKGVAVTSENSKALVKYLSDVENMNLKRIPVNKSVGRMGWIKDGLFSPYVEGLVYDGDDGYRYLYDAIGSKGKAEAWIDFVKKIRAEGRIPAKIVLAASFASVLIKPCNKLPFFLHLWGGTGNGKTVALMLAASVWGNPAVGEYINTFNSTAVGQELIAGFLNSMPLIFDEMQIQTSDNRKDFDAMIYKLTEGTGRDRGAKEGGLRKKQTWRNCILTSGEQPIMTSKSGGGAVNRVIEIDTSGEYFFNNAKTVADFLVKNYGHAGRMFVELLSDSDVMDFAIEAQDTFFEKMYEGDITEKQALAGSLILAADALIDTFIFKDGNGLKIDDMKKFLLKNADIEVGKRAYEWLLDWIAQNYIRFTEDGSGEVWGKDYGDRIHIIRSVFNNACNDAGYNPKVLLNWLRDNKLIETEGRAMTKRVTVNKSKCQCVILLNYDEAEIKGFEPMKYEEEQIKF